MGQPKSASFRRKVVMDRKSENLSYSELSRRYTISYNTAKSICESYDQHGESSLTPDYSKCGLKISEESEKIYRLVRLVKHYHQGWGIPFILTKLSRKFPELTYQSVRTYQRRLALEKPTNDVPAAIVPKVKPLPKVYQAHDEWQIDAKERIVLSTGQGACYLNITDTKTHAILKAKPFPPRADQSSRSLLNSSITFGYV